MEGSGATGRGNTRQKGRVFYQHRAQIVVSIPCVIRGTGDREFRQDDTQLLISAHSLPGLSEVYVNDPNNVKQFILDNVGNRRKEGKRIIWEGSDVVYLLDETREWKISEQSYDPATGQTAVPLNRTLRGVPMLWGNLLHPHLIMEEFSHGYERSLRLRGAREIHG